MSRNQSSKCVPKCNPTQCVDGINLSGCGQKLLEFGSNFLIKMFQTEI